MKTQKFLLIGALLFFMMLLLTSCFHDEDPGPLQDDERDFQFLDFERLEMGDAFVVTVQQSPVYSIHVRGDRRNLDDLDVTKVGATLKIGFDESGNRDHTTYIDIKMPVLLAVNFSGASATTITGFNSENPFDIILSGASVAQVDLSSPSMKMMVSGASTLTMIGDCNSAYANVSGASQLNAYTLIANNATMEASGASEVKVFANATLKATASGASVIRYRGNPTVNFTATGASHVSAD